MAHKHIILIFAALAIVTVLSGCLDGNRHDAARLKWQRTIDQARIEAAQQELEKGRLQYAERILKECDRCTEEADLAEQVGQLREQLRVEHARYAKADGEPAGIEETAF